MTIEQIQELDAPIWVKEMLLLELMQEQQKKD